MGKSLHMSTRILKVCIESLTGFSHIFSSDGLNETFSQGCILEMAAIVGMVGRKHTFSGNDRGMTSLQLPGSNSQVNHQSQVSDCLQKQIEALSR